MSITRLITMANVYGTSVSLDNLEDTYYKALGGVIHIDEERLTQIEEILLEAGRL
jgi:hypothetical protein